MNIDKRLNEMEPKDTPLLVLGYIILSMFLLIPLSSNADDNEVFLGNITGDNLVLDILQAGTDNLITGIADTSVLNGDDNTLYIKQQGTGHVFQGNWQYGGNNTVKIFMGAGQDNGYIKLDGYGTYNSGRIYQGKHLTETEDADETGGHEAYWTVRGDHNTFASSQTDTNRASGGNNAGPHHLANIITGDYNDVDHRQLGKSGHDGFIEITGDNNDVVLYQRGNGGVKWADIVLDGNGHSVDVNQRGSNNATATVDLTYGTGAYNFDLTQNVGSSAVSYSITGICQNVSGCSVSINQDN